LLFRSPLKIKRNARCVEIDCWPDDDLGAPNVKVTHGYTLTSRLPIRPVLSTIRTAFDEAPSDLPVVISLENHTKDDAFQQGLVEALHETLGGTLVGGEQQEWSARGTPPTLDDFKGKIFCMVEFYQTAAKAEDDASSSSSSSEDESDDEETKRHRREKKAAKGVIGPALAELGFYAASIKPAKGDGWLFGGSSPYGLAALRRPSFEKAEPVSSYLSAPRRARSDARQPAAQRRRVPSAQPHHQAPARCHLAHARRPLARLPQGPPHPQPQPRPALALAARRAGRRAQLSAV